MEEIKNIIENGNAMTNEMGFDAWVAKYKPIKNWLNKNDPDAETFETYGVEVGVVLGVNRFNPKQVWTLIEGDEGLWITSGYHFVNRVNYFITEIPFEGEGYLDVLYDRYSDYDNEDDEAELQWMARVSALASAKTEDEVEAIIEQHKK
jgi:hypothetical protein